MSLKIYNGYVFKKNMSLLELNERMIRLRETYRKRMIETYENTLIRWIYFYEDLYVIDKAFCLEKMKSENMLYGDFEEDAAKTIAFNVESHYRDVVTSDMNSQNPLLDFAAEIQLFPIKDKILLLFYGSYKLEKILEGEDDIEEYHYQNQTDKPESITEQEWNERYDDWKKAMPTWEPEKSGFSVKLFLEIDIPLFWNETLSKEHIKAKKRDVDMRVDSIITHYPLLDKYMDANASVFDADGYKNYIKDKRKEFEVILKDRPDPLNCLLE